MAEAAVITRYFCHQCSQETSSVLPDYTCPRCRSGFIEEVVNESANDSLRDDSRDDESPSRQVFDLFDHYYGPFDSSPRHSFRPSSESSNSSMNTPRDANSDAGSASHSQSSPSRSRERYFQVNISPRTPDSPFDAQQPLEGLFQHIFANFATQGVGGRDGRGLTGFNIDFPFFQVLHGNPADYAWGSGGLDVVITQLLNQLDGAGPPPMPKEDIERLPYVSINAEQVSKNLQCTVCMEDFKLGEKVKELACSHCYHKDCIIPWLQMHATCPVCRKELSNRNASQSTHSRNFAANSSNLSQNLRTSGPQNSTRSPNTSQYESTDEYD